MKYKNHEIQDDGFTDWIKPNMNIYRVGCCDCGLVHDIVFSIEEGYIIFKAKRNSRATGQKGKYNELYRNAKNWEFICEIN